MQMAERMTQLTNLENETLKALVVNSVKLIKNTEQQLNDANSQVATLHQKIFGYDNAMSLLSQKLDSAEWNLW